MRKYPAPQRWTPPVRQKQSVHGLLLEHKWMAGQRMGSTGDARHHSVSWVDSVQSSWVHSLQPLPKAKVSEWVFENTPWLCWQSSNQTARAIQTSETHWRKTNTWQGTGGERGEHLQMGTQLLIQLLGRSHLFVLKKVPWTGVTI